VHSNNAFRHVYDDLLDSVLLYFHDLLSTRVSQHNVCSVCYDRPKTHSLWAYSSVPS